MFKGTLLNFADYTVANNTEHAESDDLENLCCGQSNYGFWQGLN